MRLCFFRRFFRRFFRLSFGLVLFVVPLRQTTRCQGPRVPPLAGRLNVLWEASFATAEARAKRLQRPILFALLGAKDGASRRMLREVYTAPEVRKLLAELVPIIGCADTVPTIDTGPRRGTSTLFPSVTVAQHQANVKLAAKRYVGEPVLVPQHLLISPDGHLLERHVGFLDGKHFAKLLSAGIARVDATWRAQAKRPATAGASESGAASELSFAGLFDADATMRAKTARRLVETPDKELVLRLYRQIQDPETRRLVLEAARRKDMAWVGPLVTEALADEHELVRVEALSTATASGLASLAPSLLSGYRHEERGDVQRKFLAALGACAHDDKKALAAITSATKDRDERTRGAAYLSLAAAGRHSPATAKHIGDILVKRGLKDRDLRARGAAAWALGELRLKGARSAIVKRVARQRRKDRRIFRAAIERIDGGDPKDWDKLRRQTERSRR